MWMRLASRRQYCNHTRQYTIIPHSTVATFWFWKAGPTLFFRYSMRKVHTLRPAVQTQNSDFTLTITKNNIHSTGVKLASPHLVFALTRDMDCPSFFLPRCVIYYYFFIFIYLFIYLFFSIFWLKFFFFKPLFLWIYFKINNIIKIKKIKIYFWPANITFDPQILLLTRKFYFRSANFTFDT